MPTPRTGPAVLIVDDDRMFCQVLPRLPRGGRLRHGGGHHGRRRLECARRKGCALVLLDLYMVRETGMDALITLRPGPARACPWSS